MQHVFIIGSKGIPGAYGGFETFVDKLTEHHQDCGDLQYHVACKNADETEYWYHNARCFTVRVPNLGPAQAIYYDVAAMGDCLDYIRKNQITHPIVYVLACRIGPFMRRIQQQIHRLGGRLYVNPDGHEWLRGKWSKSVKAYWRYSEKKMVKHADLLVCDSKHIQRYIHKEYQAYHPKTVFIAYGAEEAKTATAATEIKLQSWYQEHDLTAKGYYLIVGRFVPENNYETILREFMAADTQRKLVIITTANDKLMKSLVQKLGFRSDPRIHFVGTVYDSDLLQGIRQNAYGYLHGHEVGGTNPSLLEALGSTDLNLLLDVDFNREVGEDTALYWTKEPDNLRRLIQQAEDVTVEERRRLGAKAKQHIRDSYSWMTIARQYHMIFDEGHNGHQ